MRTKLFFALVLPLPFAFFVACGSGTDDGKSSDDGTSDASRGADIGSPMGADGGSTHDSDGAVTASDGGVTTTGDSGAKDAGAKKDAAGPGRTDGGDCIGNGGDPMFGYELQCKTGVALEATPCTAGHNDCPAADGCCYVDPTSDCVKANGPQCVTLTGF